MNRWYFWVLAPVMVAAAVMMPFVAAPATLAGQIAVYVFSAALLLATLGLADTRRFHWALQAVAGVVLAAGAAYFAHELLAWWGGKPIGIGGRRSSRSLWNAATFLVVFGVPALRFLIAGRSDSAVDVLLTESRPAFHDEVLGAVHWSEDDGAWVARATQSRASFKILITGAERPDARLIPHARDLYVSPESLLGGVPGVLRAAANQIPEAAHEILGLHVESVVLPWPDRPDDGMVYFDGPRTDERVWRSDYLRRKIQPLGFDD